MDFEKQKLCKDTLNILAVINYKFWTKDSEHKKWLLKQYKNNEEICNNIEVKELFKGDNEKENEMNKRQELIVIKNENILKKIINFIKNI